MDSASSAPATPTSGCGSKIAATLFTLIRDHPHAGTRTDALKRIQGFVASCADKTVATAATAIIVDPKYDNVSTLHALRALLRPPSEDEKGPAGEAPTRTKKGPPARTPTRTPPNSAARTPTRTPPNSPARAPTRTPPRPPVPSPVPSPAKTPVPSPARTPVPSPAAPPCCGGRQPSGRELSRLRDVELELEIITKAPGSGGRTYLDIGSAEGRITAAIACALSLPRERAHACDVAPQAPLDTVTFALSGPTALPYSDASFDIVTMFMAAHHFTDAAAMFKEARRVSKNDAVLLLREHDCRSEAAQLYYDVVHAFYACVFGEEATPEQFVEQYSAGGFAFYRSQASWIRLAYEHGFKLHRGAQPHGPVVPGAVDADRYGADRYDSFYVLFQARPTADRNS